MSARPLENPGRQRGTSAAAHGGGSHGRRQEIAITVVSAERLLEQAWDENADPFTQTVKVTIARLRRKLGEPPIIQTITGVGYQIGSTDTSSTNPAGRQKIAAARAEARTDNGKGAEAPQRP